MKACMAERVIRTLKNLLYKRFSINGSYRWLNELQGVVNKYNNSVHRTINMKPRDVTIDDEDRLLKTVYAISRTNPRIKPKLKIGDPVRVSKHKQIFDKGYHPNWSTEIFRIVNVRDKTLPHTYTLEDSKGQPIAGCFYKEELQKTKYPDVYLVEKVLKKKGNLVYVKWLGFKEKSWVNKKDLL